MLVSVCMYCTVNYTRDSILSPLTGLIPDTRQLEAKTWAVCDEAPQRREEVVSLSSGFVPLPACHAIRTRTGSRPTSRHGFHDQDGDGDDTGEEAERAQSAAVDPGGKFGWWC